MDTSRPFTVAMWLAAGNTRRQLQSPRFQRLFQGVYIDTDAQPTPELLAAAAALVLPSGAAVGGSTAALLRGADVRRLGDDLVEVVTAREDQVRRRGIRSRAALLEPGDVEELYGVPVLSSTRVAFDFARQKSLLTAVAHVDAMLNRGGCSLDELAEYVGSHGSWRWIQTARRVLVHAEPQSQSVMESLQRMRLVLAGLPRPRAQAPVVLASGTMAYIDNGYEEWKVGADYDGEVHAATWRHDLERQESIRDQGWWHRRYTSLHISDGWERMVRQIGAALLAAGWRPA